MKKAVLAEKRFGFTKTITVAEFAPIIRIPVQKKFTLDEITHFDQVPLIDIVDFEYVIEDKSGTLYYREVDA